MCAAFEEWAVEEGWAQLVLPSRQEAEEYFTNFRLNKAVEGASAAQDEDIVQGMVDELHMVMKSVRFSAATLVRAILLCGLHSFPLRLCRKSCLK